MSQPIDLSQLPHLPVEVLNAFAAVQFDLPVEAEKDAFITELIENWKARFSISSARSLGRNRKSLIRRRWNGCWKISRLPCRNAGPDRICRRKDRG